MNEALDSTGNLSLHIQCSWYLACWCVDDHRPTQLSTDLFHTSNHINDFCLLSYLRLALSLNNLTKVGSPNSCICSTITAHVSFKIRVCVKEGKMPLGFEEGDVIGSLVCPTIPLWLGYPLFIRVATTSNKWFQDFSSSIVHRPARKTTGRIVWHIRGPNISKCSNVIPCKYRKSLFYFENSTWTKEMLEKIKEEYCIFCYLLFILIESVSSTDILALVKKQ